MADRSPVLFPNLTDQWCNDMTVATYTENSDNEELVYALESWLQFHKTSSHHLESTDVQMD